MARASRLSPTPLVTAQLEADRSFRPAILRLLSANSDVGLTLEEIEDRIGGYVRGHVTGSVEDDAASLVREGLLERSRDNVRLFMSALARELLELASRT